MSTSTAMCLSAVNRLILLENILVVPIYHNGDHSWFQEESFKKFCFMLHLFYDFIMTVQERQSWDQTDPERRGIHYNVNRERHVFALSITYERSLTLQCHLR